MNDLIFLTRDKYGIDYGEDAKDIPYRNISYETVIDNIKDNEQPNVVVSTKIKSLGFINNNFMAFDCDSVDGLFEATLDLQLLEYRYYIVESTPNHFWIFTNKIGWLDSIFPMMDKVGGIDEKHRRIAEEQREIVFRAFPKKGIIPNFNYCYKLDSFHDNYLLRSNYERDAVVLNWIYQFQDYFESEEMSAIINEKNLIGDLLNV